MQRKLGTRIVHEKYKILTEISRGDGDPDGDSDGDQTEILCFCVKKLKRHQENFVSLGKSSTTVLRTKALYFANEFSYKEFQVSDGWLDRWKIDVTFLSR